MSKCDSRSHCLAHWAGWYLYGFYNTFAAFEEFHWSSTGYLENCLIVHCYEQMWLQKPPFGALSRVIIIWFLQYIRSFGALSRMIFIWFFQYIRSFQGIPLNFNWISKEFLNCALLWADVTPEATVWRTEPGDIDIVFTLYLQLLKDSIEHLKNCLT